MQIKNSILLLTALTAGSAVARLHGHERRHQHQERGVGTWVTAVIDGVTVSWQNTYAGPTEAAAGAAAAATTTAAAAVANVENVAAAAVSTSSASTTSSSAATGTGFGGVSTPTGSGDTYCGNVGVPYGSNIIEITESELSSYDYTITLDGSGITEEYTAYFWNKCGETGELTGFFADSYWNVTIASGSSAYVAIDTDSQGGFIAVPTSDGLPRSSTDGIILGFWGEFDFADTENDGWSGFDVSAIQAQENGVTDYPGLKLEGDNQSSAITTDLADVINAYTSALADEGGIGGNVASGSLALTATLNYSG